MKRQQIIVLDGPDMCGKTQIARELSHRTGVPYYKASDEHQAFVGKQDYFVNSLKYSDTRLVDFIRQTETSVIFDRCWPSEFVYAKFFDRPTDLETLWEIDRRYAQLGAKIIFCTRTSFEGIHDDLKPDWIGPHELERLNSLYQDFAMMTKCEIKWLIVDDENLDREVTEIQKFLDL